MRQSLIGVTALAVLLVFPPGAFARAPDPPREDPLREHELAIRKVLDSWNDIATALSLIRDASGARKLHGTLQDSLIAASKTGNRMAQLKKPTAEQDRELCQRVLTRARAVRTRLNRESERVGSLPDLGPETRTLLDKVALAQRTLNRIVSRGESTPPAAEGKFERGREQR